jgi:dihydrofolate reductase
MQVSLIVAMADNGVIGRGGQMPWRLSFDLRRFKRLTMGHHLIMGRKTYESIGRSLPGRTTIVLTRQENFAPEETLVAHDLNQALRWSADDAAVFIVGGAEVYRQALELADRLYLTRVHANVEGDVFFPAFDESAWNVIERSEHLADEKNDYDCSFFVLDRQPKRDNSSRRKVRVVRTAHPKT